MIGNRREEYRLILNLSPPFYLSTSNEFAIGFMEYLDEIEQSYYWVSEIGGVPAFRIFGYVYQYVIETGQNPRIVSEEYLDRSEDGVFVRIREPERAPQKLPNAEEILGGKNGR